jgi:hypothetical protein
MRVGVAILLAMAIAPMACSVQQPKGLSGRPPEFSALESALGDLLSWEESPFFKRRDPNSKLFFDPYAPGAQLKVEDILHGFDLSAWGNLSAAQRRAVREAAEDSAVRFQAQEPVGGFRSKGERIALWEKGREREPHWLGGPQVFRANAFGLSSDGRIAIIHLSFPMDIHAGFGTYVLEWRGENWEVIVRDFGQTL